MRAGPRPLRRGPGRRRTPATLAPPLGALVVAVMVMVGAVGPVVVVPAAVAPTAPNAPAAPEPLTLLETPAWTDIGQRANLRIDVADAAAGSSIRMTVYSPLSARSSFDETLLDGGSLGAPLSSTSTLTTAVADLPLDPRGGRVLSVSVGAGEAPSVPITATGVYPVRVELRSGNATQGSFVTYLVAVRVAADGRSVDIAQPLSFSWIWRVVANPATAPDGEPNERVVAEMAPTGRLGRLATALGSATDVPITLAPGPETLAAWSALKDENPSLAAGWSSISAATREREVIVQSYVPTDLPSLDAAGLGGAAATGLAEGLDSLRATLGIRPDPRSAMPGPIDAGALGLLSQAGVDRLVLDADALLPLDPPLTRTLVKPFAVIGGERTFQAVMPDAKLNAVMVDDASPAVRAQQLLAGLSFVALETFTRDNRGIVVSTPADWNPPAELLSAALAGLRGNPLIKPVQLGTFMDTVPVETGRPGVRELDPPRPVAPPITAASYREAEIKLASFVSLLGSAVDPAVLRSEQNLVLALCSCWNSDPAAAQSYLAQNNETIDKTVGSVDMPTGRSVTITDRRAAIPVSFRNESGRTLFVRVRMTSNKLLFPDGAEQTIQLPPRTTTMRFEVETRSSGTFPLVLTVTSADGNLAVTQARLTVRSTVVSGWGIFLTVGAALFLALWWLNHFRKRRRLRAAVALTASGEGEGQPA